MLTANLIRDLQELQIYIDGINNDLSRKIVSDLGLVESAKINNSRYVIIRELAKIKEFIKI